ncbi:uncharacterized protein B0H18DRAFT_1122076 [Fomitopsis serialis]|uniref:uncharacterized protein n=1 Tax=Fomitopsis serialis TaxID=139415 RepID=UPI0020085E3E|nr:uncharacterized protein B0H18DRAFT_1122076 [Neoantrodia serialis]KAH9920347.1 hypothetical protein B0H18DRAFT_1122076 [Neoantrodia serialis]
MAEQLKDSLCLEYDDLRMDAEKLKVFCYRRNFEGRLSTSISSSALTLFTLIISQHGSPQHPLIRSREQGQDPGGEQGKTPAARKSAGAGVATKSSSSKADSGADAVPVLSYAARLKAMKESLRSLLPNLTAQELDAMARSNLAKGSKGISGRRSIRMSKGKNPRSPGKSTPITTPRKRKTSLLLPTRGQRWRIWVREAEKKKTRTQRQDQSAEQATAAGSRTAKAKKKAAPIVLAAKMRMSWRPATRRGIPRKETRSSKAEGKHVAKGNSSRREPSPWTWMTHRTGRLFVQGLGRDGEDEDESADQLLSKDEEAPNEMIVKMEEESESKGKKRRQPRKKARREEDVDVRSLLGKAQQELRVYLALENAWPRMKKGVSEKHAATADIVERLITSNVRYQREDFQKKFEPNWAFQKTKNKIIAYVNKAAPQLRQELKQKAKRVVEKEFLSIRLPEVGADGKPVDAVERNQKVKKARENRIKFLKDNNTFHYGQLVLPDPEVDPSLWEEPDLDMPFHGLCVAEVIANQWFRGQNPDVFRPACKERFDLDGALKTIPSNMIALACSAILVALDEWMNDNNTVEFQEKVYAPAYDRLLSGVEMIRRLANPNNKDYDEGWENLSESLNASLSKNIRVFAGLRVDSQSGQGEEKSNADLDPLINAGKVKARWRSRGGAPDNAQAGPSNAASKDKA